MTLAAVLCLAYLIGSVNFAILVLKGLGKGDPRSRFSGNAGTTNVRRQAGTGWAATVLLLDVGRAAAIAATSLAYLPREWAPWVGLALVTGNRFPVFHGFRGGKGVATYLGLVAVFSPWGAALGCLVWVGVQRLAGTPFVASFAMVLILGGAASAALGRSPLCVAGSLLTVALILWGHRQNLMAFLAERRNRDNSPASASGGGGKRS